MDPKAWGLFPFYAGAILMVMLRPVGEATALAIFLGLYAVIMRGHTVALSGFALTMTWLVVGAYIIAQAFRDTNLGKRISFWMIRIFGRSTLGLGYAAAFADFIIAPVTPSNAARTGGIIYPIFLSVAESLGSYPDKNPRGFGAYISVLLYVVTMCTGITFLTGYAANTVAWALADQMLGLHITWLQWTTAFILPAGIVLLIAPYVMYLIYRPTLTKIDNVRIAREGLAAIGPMSSKEKILLCLFVRLGHLFLYENQLHCRGFGLHRRLPDDQCSQVEGYCQKQPSLDDIDVVRRHSGAGRRHESIRLL